MAVLFGGYSNGTELGDTWLWDGSRWALVGPSRSPSPRFVYSMTYDPIQRRIVLFGGSRNGLPSNETFEMSPLAPGLFLPYGPGCPGTLGVAGLLALPGQYPFVGERFSLEITNVKSVQTAALVLGLSRTSWGGTKLPFSLTGLGLAGCNLYLSVDFQSFLSAPAVSFTIPAAASLVGKSIFVQTIVNDPLVNRLGLVVSDAYEACLGSK